MIGPYPGWKEGDNSMVMIGKEKIDNNVCKRFVSWKGKVGNALERIMGVSVDGDERIVHKFINYNQYEEEPVVVPENFKKSNISSERLEKYFCGKLALIKPPSSINQTITDKIYDAMNYHYNFTGTDHRVPGAVRLVIHRLQSKGGYILHELMMNEKFYISEKDFTTPEDNQWMFNKIMHSAMVDNIIFNNIKSGSSDDGVPLTRDIVLYRPKGEDFVVYLSKGDRTEYKLDNLEIQKVNEFELDGETYVFIASGEHDLFVLNGNNTKKHKLMKDNVSDIDELFDNDGDGLLNNIDLIKKYI